MLLEQMNHPLYSHMGEVSINIDEQHIHISVFTDHHCIKASSLAMNGRLFLISVCSLVANYLSANDMKIFIVLSESPLKV